MSNSRLAFMVAAGLALVLTAAQAAVGNAGAVSDSARYRRCMADSSANPGVALADAESWVRAGGGVPSEHCAALALFNLKRYAEAGTRLDRIAGGRATLSAEFRVALFDQAGNAWLMAGDGAHAVQSFSGALALSASDADLFADLARAQAMRRCELVDAQHLSPAFRQLKGGRASHRAQPEHQKFVFAHGPIVTCFFPRQSPPRRA